ncbi:MAG: Gfo/Idh/MocA family oxidoreductase, partial [Candidatus Omnitrophica bacterium]|nr:Gfo/Idh/MocA family oxidoreductase [Candidatus Omnitrophota bacterium]
MKEQIKVCFIGCGKMANEVHLPNFTSYDDVKVVALCDINQEALEQTGKRYNIDLLFNDYRKMIEKTSPDAAVIIGQPEVMFTPILWCLENKIHVYTEKPLGVNLHSAHILADAAEKNGCITQVSFQRRACPLLVKLREECLKKGPIVHAVCEFYKCDITPFKMVRDHMLDDGVHAIDTLRWICGGEAKNIYSKMKSINVPDRNFIIGVIEFDNGATGIMINSWASGRRIFRVEMHSPGICAEGNPESKGYIYKDNDIAGIELDIFQVAGTTNPLIAKGFERKNREFIECIKRKCLPSSHFGDALKTMEIAEKMLSVDILN